MSKETSLKEIQEEKAKIELEISDMIEFFMKKHNIEVFNVDLRVNSETYQSGKKIRYVENVNLDVRL